MDKSTEPGSRVGSSQPSNIPSPQLPALSSSSTLDAGAGGSWDARSDAERTQPTRRLKKASFPLRPEVQGTGAFFGEPEIAFQTPRALWRKSPGSLGLPSRHRLVSTAPAAQWSPCASWPDGAPHMCSTAGGLWGLFDTPYHSPSHDGADRTYLLHPPTPLCSKFSSAG